jgi:uncharacterized phage protein (TIGR02218 family)
MRFVPPPLQEQLNSGVTTLARAWIIQPKTGEALGFTEHDRDLIVEGVLCSAGAGFTSGELDSSAGLQVDSGGWSGALSAEGLSEADLTRGRYDGATVKAYFVDWRAPENAVALWSGALGEVRRTESAFEAELKSPGALLSAPLGRMYARLCDADLGDSRCGVNLDTPAFLGTGTVTGILGARRFAASGLSSLTSGLFSRGLLTWTSGANAGAASEIVRHTVSGDAAILETLELNAHAIAVGDAFSIKAGCDKSFAVCRDQFSNQANFRGFPHIPGDDVLQAAPAAGVTHNGAARR